MITVDSKLNAGQNVFAYVASINGNEISVLTRIPDNATEDQVDELAHKALTKIKQTLFENLSQKT